MFPIQIGLLLAEPAEPRSFPNGFWDFLGVCLVAQEGEVEHRENLRRRMVGG
jgi:hypothetical protein